MHEPQHLAIGRLGRLRQRLAGLPVATEPALKPLGGGDAVRCREIMLESRADDLLLALEPVQVDVRQRQRAVVVLPQQRERRRGDGARDAQPGGEALAELRLAGAEVADEADDPARPQLRRPALPLPEGFLRFIGNERIHERRSP